MIQAGIVQTPAVEFVLKEVDRGNYISQNPYADAPQGIGQGQTISAPHMHAHALEELYPYLLGKDELKILDVGVGSGYLTACLGRFLQPKRTGGSANDETSTLVLATAKGVGKVLGIDVFPDLIEAATTNIRKEDADLLDSGMVRLQVGDGWNGLPSEAPFDAIHVGAAADSVPYDLMSQLKLGGVLVVPIGAQNGPQSLYRIQRTGMNNPLAFDARDYEMARLLGVRYVPLVHANAGNEN